jgi:hypothetical protein
MRPALAMYCFMASIHDLRQLLFGQFMIFQSAKVSGENNVKMLEEAIIFFIEKL